MAAARVRVSGSMGKMRGGERAGRRRASYPPGECGMATVAKRLDGDGGERVRSLQREDDDTFPENPLLLFSFSVFIFK